MQPREDWHVVIYASRDSWRTYIKSKPLATLLLYLNLEIKFTNNMQDLLLQNKYNTAILHQIPLNITDQ